MHLPSALHLSAEYRVAAESGAMHLPSALHLSVEYRQHRRNAPMSRGFETPTHSLTKKGAANAAHRTAMTTQNVRLFQHTSDRVTDP